MLVSWMFNYIRETKKAAKHYPSSELDTRMYF